MFQSLSIFEMSKQKYSPAEQAEFIRTISQHDLVDYSIVMDPSWIPSWHHEVMAEALMKVEKREIKRLIITLPPRHGKSRLSSELFPSWVIGRNPRTEIITASYSFELAADFGRKVRNFVADPNFQFIFGVQMAEDSAAKNRWHTKEGGGYVAAGVGGSITGRGANILIIDDVFKDRAEAESQLIREKVWNWYTSTAYTRLSPDGAIVICNTRWHDDDLVGRLLREEPEKWVHIDLPALATEDEPHRKAGEPLWPDRFTLDDLMNIKDSIGSYDWSALYQQNPIDEESAVFKRSMFRYWHTAPNLSDLWIVTGIDPAISKKETADYSAVVTLGIQGSMRGDQIIGKIYVLDYVNKRMNPSELIEEIFVQKQKWNPDVFAVETVAYQAALTHFLRDAMIRRGVMLRIEEVKSTIQKEKRINGLIPYYQSAMVEHAPWMNDLEEQLLRFPVGTHDDLVDAMSHSIPFWIPKQKASVAPQKNKINYRQLLKKEENMQYQTAV